MSFDATLVVLAAGMGSRFGGLKQIEPIGKNGEALLDFTVYDAKAAGFNKVVFIIKHEIEADFKKFVGNRIEKQIEVEYAFQETNILPKGFECPAERTKPWGTAHAIWCCRDIVKTPFVVVNADDYYGKQAFKQLFDELKKANDEYCMVGFRLKNTLTENGTVSRGVCETKDGYLQSVTERTKILDCKYEENGEWIPLDENTIVSMNMWGFTPDIFRFAENELIGFLEKNINEAKSECYLPSVVSTLLTNGTKKVKVLVAEDKWYGVTYKEDKELVVKALNEKIDNGEYFN